MADVLSQRFLYPITIYIVLAISSLFAQGCAHNEGPRASRSTTKVPSKPTLKPHGKDIWSGMEAYLSYQNERRKRAAQEINPVIPTLECNEESFLGSPDTPHRAPVQTDPSCWEPLLSIDIERVPKRPDFTPIKPEDRNWMRDTLNPAPSFQQRP